MNIQNFDAMSDEVFDEWVTEMMQLDIQERIKKIENSKEYQNSTGMKPETKEKIIKHIMKMEKGLGLCNPGPFRFAYN